MLKKVIDTYEFVYQTTIDLDRDENGVIISYNPANGYKKKDTCKLNPYGHLQFCKLNLVDLPTTSGVYAIYNDGELVYIGRAKNFAERWSRANYGNISPKNCYVGGQSTNCKMNNYIFEAIKAGCKIELYFYATTKYKEIEKDLLGKYAENLSLNKQKN